jgi:hypothetical protein
LDRGTQANAFKFYLADHPDDLALYEQGDVDAAYRHFMLWQSGRIAEEVRVLFDPDTLASRLFPRPRALKELLALLNDPVLADVWQAEETIGWVYEYFSEPERKEWGQRSGPIPPGIVPIKTQLFTPHWVVRVLVHNTLGRLWVCMHPDTQLLGTEALDYLVPLEEAPPAEPLRSVKEITLLDPACGGMHFGLVAFDLFAAMYAEELGRAGEPGWPRSPSVAETMKIPEAILAHNLFGIDIDLRAVQLSALALYVKAKTLNPQTTITRSNLACADVTPLNGGHLGAFVREARFERPVYERLMRALWEKLQDVQQLGSLLRLETELEALIEEERAHYRERPLFAGLEGEFEAEAAEEEFWDVISAQIIQGLNEFARQQARSGVDQTFFTGEATKGLRLLDLTLRRYDVVVTNPPYLSSRDYNPELKELLQAEYSDSNQNLYAAFVERGFEFLSSSGRLGILTGQSFMFITSYAKFRKKVLNQAAIEILLHFDYHLFDNARMDTACYVLRPEQDSETRVNSVGTYFRLVHQDSGDAKREAFEAAMQDLRLTTDD